MTKTPLRRALPATLDATPAKTVTSGLALGGCFQTDVADRAAAIAWAAKLPAAATGAVEVRPGHRAPTA